MATVDSGNRVMRLLFQLHRWAYRRSRGRVGARFLGVPMLLLTTTGRRTGRPHTTALTYLKDGEHLVVVASNGGARQHPAWFLNLRASPHAQVQVGSMLYGVRASEAAGAERERLWTGMIQLYRGYRGYQARTARRIPVVILEPLSQPAPAVTTPQTTANV
jgi:deazaflavin-dependent oxidoreductase (nitroreductase family)